jgi:plastocyanin
VDFVINSRVWKIYLHNFKMIHNVYVIVFSYYLMIKIYLNSKFNFIPIIFIIIAAIFFSQSMAMTSALTNKTTIEITKGVSSVLGSMKGGGEVPELSANYKPSLKCINPGTNVTWTNNDPASHTVTSGNPLEGPNSIFDSEILESGDSFSYVFNTIVDVEYFDKLDPNMKGVIIVAEGCEENN